MRAAARRHLPIIVLDRPNPINGVHVDGPMLDTALGESREPDAATTGQGRTHYIRSRCVTE